MADTQDKAQRADLDLLSDEFLSPAVELDNSGNPAPTMEYSDDSTDEADSDAGEPASGVPAPVQQTRGTREFVREIDLGDGSGKQVFKGNTPDELIDALTKAQENASRKIREQELTIRRASRVRPDRAEPQRSVAPQRTELTADQKFAIAQEFQKDPEAALDKLLAAKGLSIADLQAVPQIVTDREYGKAEASFLRNHEGVDYLPTPQNAQAIVNFLRDESLPYTAQNLEYAFQELSESGLLQMPTQGEQPKTGKDGESESGESRIAVPAHTRRKPMSSGLSSKQSGAQRGAEARAEQTDRNGVSESEVEEIYALPLEQARAKMDALMRKASGRR